MVKDNTEDVWDVFSDLHHNDRGKLQIYWMEIALKIRPDTYHE